MSITVRQLNGDSTFLLLFSPERNPTPADLRTANGAFSILIDPWLTGRSVTTAPWFAVTSHVEPTAIQHLSELEDEPDVVVCSQNKTDHTNKETLLQLPSDSKIKIVAEPGAAKTVKSWNYFEPSQIHALNKYDAKARSGNILRLHVPPLSPDGLAGEVTVAFIPAKNYVTGLHNAFGITYQPPTKSRSWPQVPEIKVSTEASDFDHLLVTPPGDDSCLHNCAGGITDFPFFDFAEPLKPEPFSITPNLPTPPASPLVHAFTRTSSSSTVASLKRLNNNPSGQPQSSTETRKTSGASDEPVLHAPRPKAISVIYSPHGVSFSDLRPYVKNHLLSLPGALPLTLLLHSFDHATNPWFLGGNIMTGAEGGMQIARALMAQHWISAHDEEKDDQGVATKLLKIQRNGAVQVKQQIQASDDGISRNWYCDIRRLAVGEQLTLSNTKSNSTSFQISSPGKINNIISASSPAIIPNG